MTDANRIKNNTAIVSMYEGYIRKSIARLSAVERHRMIILLRYVREEAQFGEDIPPAASLLEAKSADTLIELIAATAGETIEETVKAVGNRLLSRDQAGKAILNEASDIIWFSEDIKQKAMATSDTNARDALYQADHLLAIANNCAK